MSELDKLNLVPKAQPCISIASVERKVLSSYGWCSHFVGEPVAYAIFKERRGLRPSRVEPDQLDGYDRLPALNTTLALATPLKGEGKE